MYEKLKTEAKRSHCLDRRNACFICDERDNILAKGVNLALECVTGCPKLTGGACTVIHAEEAATRNYKKNHDLVGATQAYTLYQPCRPCVLALQTCGVGHITFYSRSLKEVPNVQGMVIKKEGKPHYHLSRALERVREYHTRTTYLFGESTQQERLRNLCLALHQEVGELTDAMQWKPWRLGSGINHYNMHEELADVIIFIDSILQQIGSDWKDMAEAIDDKLKLVNERLVNGYNKTE